MDKSFYEVFNVVIQMGSILAVVWLYPQQFKQFIAAPFQRQQLTIGLAILPVLIIGYLLKDIIKSVLFSPATIFAGLIIGGIGLIIADFKVKYQSDNDDRETITYKQATMIGIWQCLALWPGMSRSAMTIMGGLAVGLNRTTAASFSFIIAVPLLIIICSYDLFSAVPRFSLAQLGYIGLGTLLSFFIALFTMRWFLKLIQFKGLSIFGVYRIILGSIGFLFYL